MTTVLIHGVFNLWSGVSVGQELLQRCRVAEIPIKRV
jgi:hypothetical protein